MAANTKRTLSVRKRLAFAAIVCAMVLGIVLAGLEWAGRWLMGAVNSDYPKARLVLMGAIGDDADAGIHAAQNTLGRPYLLYVPAPNFRDADGVVQHNAHAYRGDAVPLARTPGVARILFLGGSTTYGSGVARPEQTYPAQLGEMIQSELPGDWTAVEIVNGGLPYGASSEILTHYLFKYHYYKPDVVVINSGGNDAQPNLRTHYQPDYSHWRQNVRELKPLPEYGRWMMKSQLTSFILIHAFHYETLNAGADFNRRWKSRDEPAPRGAWYPACAPDDNGEQLIPDEHLAFRHNIHSAIRAIQADGARVVLVPFRPNPYSQFYKDKYFPQFARHEAILRELATRWETGFSPFPAAVISEENWVDFCHLNAAGCKQKAAHIAPAVRQQLTMAAAAAAEPPPP
jgi:lysophospholipase L1-like esterase